MRWPASSLRWLTSAFAALGHDYDAPLEEPCRICNLAVPTRRGVRDACVLDDDYMPLGEHLATPQQAEPPLSDDELVAVRQLIEDRFGASSDTCEVPWPGREPVLCTRPDGHHGDHVAYDSDDKPVASWPQTSRAVGLQRAAGPEGVRDETPHPSPSSGPSMRPTSAVLADAIEQLTSWRDNYVVLNDQDEYLAEHLIPELRDRAAQFLAIGD